MLVYGSLCKEVAAAVVVVAVVVVVVVIVVVVVVVVVVAVAVVVVVVVVVAVVVVVIVVVVVAVAVVVVVVVVVVVNFYTSRAKTSNKNFQDTNLRPNLTYHTQVLNSISTYICLHSAREDGQCMYVLKLSR